MTKKISIQGLECLCCRGASDSSIAYILYPFDALGEWVEQAVRLYDVNIVVITGMDWQNVFSPWPAPGVPKGTPDFKGESSEFLQLLRSALLPAVEKELGLGPAVMRYLVGVSMSGLFALWQWMLCDVFTGIASMSGSFWYEGFVDWIKSRSIPHKPGKAFFLLGDKENKSKVKEFNSVLADTQQIVELLRNSGIDTEFKMVPGDHYSDPIPRLNLSFKALFG